MCGSAWFVWVSLFFFPPLEQFKGPFFAEAVAYLPVLIPRARQGLAAQHWVSKGN